MGDGEGCKREGHGHSSQQSSSSMGSIVCECECEDVDQALCGWSCPDGASGQAGASDPLIGGAPVERAACDGEQPSGAATPAQQQQQQRVLQKKTTSSHNPPSPPPHRSLSVSDIYALSQTHLPRLPSPAVHGRRRHALCSCSATEVKSTWP